MTTIIPLDLRVRSRGEWKYGGKPTRTGEFVAFNGQHKKAESGIQKPELSTNRENYNKLPTPCMLCYNSHTQLFNSEEM